MNARTAERKQKQIAKPRKPSCTGCSADLVEPLNKAGWCNNCWKIPPAK
jgi:hypothetical protein